MDASGKQIGILGYTEGALGLYQFSYAASIWSATLEFVQEISVGTSCNSDDLTVTGYSSTGYRPSLSAASERMRTELYGSRTKQAWYLREMKTMEIPFEKSDPMDLRLPPFAKVRNFIGV